MVQNWEFLLAEIWGLIALSALLGLFVGWLIWSRTKQLKAMRAQLSTRERELEHAKRDLEVRTRGFDTERAALAAERDAAVSTSNELDGRVGGLETALATAKADAQKYELHFAEVSEANQRADEELRLRADKIADLEANLDMARTRESELARFEEDYHGAIAARSKAQNAHAEEIARVRRRDEDLTTLKTELHNASTAAKRVASLEAELTRVNAKVGQMEALEAQLQEARAKENSAQKLEADLNAARAKAERADRLEAELSQVRAQVARNQQAAHDVSALKVKADKSDKLERDLSHASAKVALIGGLEATVATRETRIRQLEAQIAGNRDMQSELDSLRADVRKRDATISDLRTRMKPSLRVAEPSNVPDYDGDGVLEGRNEGSKPKTLKAARDGRADDLKMIKGVGPKLEAMLHSLGFFHFDQVASWTADEVAWVDANLEGFNGRVSRDRWIAQAKVLAAGGETEFSARAEEDGIYRSA
jgi:chromosome segregation ATPase